MYTCTRLFGIYFIVYAIKVLLYICTCFGYKFFVSLFSILRVDPTTCWFEEQKKFASLLVEKKIIYPFFDEQVKCNKTEKINLVQLIMINGEETSSTPSLLWIRIHTRVYVYIHMIIKDKLCVHHSQLTTSEFNTYI